mmetsp:Transcript_19624/g.67599  ORF Transcript_19624/g.67599 Transcript_19624/m.67599 type:complete len:237 (-) Transcript_19624:439-1149(-)
MMRISGGCAICAAVLAWSERHQRVSSWSLRTCFFSAKASSSPSSPPSSSAMSSSAASSPASAAAAPGAGSGAGGALGSCARQKPSSNMVNLVQPTAGQPRARRWFAQKLLRPRATCWQSSTWHALPPPWHTQKRLPQCADLVQLGAWQRRPPPCAVQRPVPPTAPLVHSGSRQRLPPPCAAQKNLSRAPLEQPGRWQRRPPPWLMQNLRWPPDEPWAHLVQPGYSQRWGPYACAAQ